MVIKLTPNLEETIVQGINIGYEPAGLTVHPPQNDRGWVHFFRMGV